MKHHNEDSCTSLKPSIPSRSIQRTLAVALLLTTSAAIFAATPGDTAGQTPFPTIHLPKNLRGPAAHAALGAQLGDVAKHYGMDAAKFADILKRDPAAWVDLGGRLYYVDDFPPMPQEGTTASGTTTVAAAAPFAIADTFKLHSKPGATKLIYLDFNGHTTTGSAWNTGTINAPPFDFDGVPSSFSDLELERIQYIWQRVAEDYAVFDIDVTTEEPLADALSRTSSSDDTYGSRVVITHSSIGVCSSCGGVAYVGVFNYTSPTNPDYYKPAWVLYDRLGSGNEKYVAEAISHEAGHNVGLSHDGTSTTGYYQGANGWAPIMGVGYYQNLVQWSKGEYPGANNTQDDILVIQSYGPKLAADDFGSSIATAAALSGVSSSGIRTVDQTGFIDNSSDQDYFSIVTSGGTIQLSVTPDARSPNLDVSAGLYDGLGVLIASSSPTTSLGASLNVALPAGTYYLRLDGVGNGDPLLNGYSDYGSMGHYRITGSYAESSFKAPNAVATASITSGYAPLDVAFSGDGSSDPDGTIVQYRWAFGDSSTGTGSNVVHTYTSPGTYNAVLTVTDSQGLSSSATVPVVVTPDVSASTLRVVDVAVFRNILNASKSTSQCVANVTVKSLTDVPASGATVYGKWSGVVTSGTVGAIANTTGTASFTSVKTTAKTGTCTFTVSNVSLSGKTYDPALNTTTSSSFSW